MQRRLAACLFSLSLVILTACAHHPYADGTHSVTDRLSNPDAVAASVESATTPAHAPGPKVRGTTSNDLAAAASVSTPWRRNCGFWLPSALGGASPAESSEIACEGDALGPLRTVLGTTVHGPDRDRMSIYAIHRLHILCPTPPLDETEIATVLTVLAEANLAGSSSQEAATLVEPCGKWEQDVSLYDEAIGEMNARFGQVRVLDLYMEKSFPDIYWY